MAKATPTSRGPIASWSKGMRTPPTIFLARLPCRNGTPFTNALVVGPSPVITKPSTAGRRWAMYGRDRPVSASEPRCASRSRRRARRSRDEAGDLRVRERVAVRHSDGLAPAELLVGISPEARHPLRPSVEKRKKFGAGCLSVTPCPRTSRSERDGGMPACIVADHERLRLLRRADQGVDADRLDEPPDLPTEPPGLSSPQAKKSRTLRRRSWRRRAGLRSFSPGGGLPGRSNGSSAPAREGS